MSTECVRPAGAVGGSLGSLLGDPERLVRFYAEATKFSSAETLDDVLKRVVYAACSLAEADQAELTLDVHAAPGPRVLWAGNEAETVGAVLERELQVGDRHYATLRLTTARPSFRPQEEALVELFCVHAALAIERVSSREIEALAGASHSNGRRSLVPAEATVRTVGEVSLDLARYQAFVAGAPVHLTISEFRLLELLTEEPERAYTRSEIVTRLWGKDSRASRRAADAHVARLRKKIERDPQHPQRLLSIRSVGYRLAAG